MAKVARKGFWRALGLPRASQHGFSLLETLVAVALVGIAFFGIAAGLLTTMSASSSNHARTGQTTALLATTEALKSSTYVSCATPSSLQAGWSGTRHLTDGRSYTVTITSVTYWNPATGHQTFESGTCPVAGSTKDAGTQLIGVTVRLGAGSMAGSVVVRNPVAGP